MNDPLIFGFAIVALDVVIWRCAVPRDEVARLLTRLCIYAAFSALLFSSGLSPFSQAAYPDSRALHLLGQILEIIWWLTGARLLSKVLNTLLLPKTWRRQRLFEDVFSALAFLAATVASLAFVLELPVRGLLATSGALAIVLGLAIQSTLSDVFAGIVINTTEPYEVGNWVSIDGVEGEVLEMNWRATNLLTSLGDVVIVPNAVAAKAKITNSSRPAALHGISITLEITPEARPKNVLDALTRALKNVRMILADPAPYALVKSTDAQSFQYEVTAYVDDPGKKLVVANELYDVCHRHLIAADVQLTPPGQPKNASGGPADVRIRLLRCVDLFASLTNEELELLASRMTRQEFESNQVLITPETVPDSLTMIHSGVLSVSVKEGTAEVEAGRLGPGEVVGEMGPLTGMAARVKITALTHVVTYQLNTKDLTPLFKSNPDVARLMCQSLSRRQHMLEVVGAPTPVTHSDESFLQWLIDGVRKLHGLSF